jgi:hypothetical protein
MLIIHFVDEADDQPCCRRPERAKWIWSADPSAVTCPDCASERRRIAAELPPVVVRGDPPPSAWT